jgi:hypothetical protein
MRVLAASGFQFALVKEILDSTAHKRQIEEKIQAVEEWNKLREEKAARSEIEAYIQSKMPNATKAKPNTAVSQLSLHFENIAVSAV